MVRIFEDCFLNIVLDRLQKISLGEILSSEEPQSLMAFLYVSDLFHFYVRCCEINAMANQTNYVFDASVGTKRSSKRASDEVNSVSDNQMIEHISG